MLSSLIVPLSLLATPSLQDTDWTEVRGVLERREPHDEREPEDLVRELARLGPDATPALFRMVTGFTEGLAGDGDVVRLQAPPEDLRRLALDTLASLPPTAVTERLSPLAHPDVPLEERMACARVLGALGSAHGLPLWFELTATLGPLEARYRSVRGPLQDALARILAEDPRAWRRLEDLLPDLDAEAAGLVLGAVTVAGAPRGVDLLAGWVAEVERPPSGLLDGLGELHARAPWRLAPGKPDLLRFHGDQDARLRREAALCAGRIRNLESVPALLEALEDTDPSVVRTATWALGEIGGTAAHHDAPGWRAWHLAEQRFWHQGGLALAEGLASAPREEFAKGLRTLRDHRAFRDETARLLATSLDELSPEATRRVCRALEELGSAVAVPELVALLESVRSPVRRRAAWQALRRLTGHDLPPEASRWRRALGESG